LDPKKSKNFPISKKVSAEKIHFWGSYGFSSIWSFTASKIYSVFGIFGSWHRQGGLGVTVGCWLSVICGENTSGGCVLVQSVCFPGVWSFSDGGGGGVYGCGVYGCSVWTSTD
jgi:hypothetical protein